MEVILQISLLRRLTPTGIEPVIRNAQYDYIAPQARSAAHAHTEDRATSDILPAGQICDAVFPQACIFKNADIIRRDLEQWD
jgi:hypothetical protein